MFWICMLNTSLCQAVTFQKNVNPSLIQLLSSSFYYYYYYFFYHIMFLGNESQIYMGRSWLCAIFQGRRGAYAIILPKQKPSSIYLLIPVMLGLFSSDQTAIIYRITGKTRIYQLQVNIVSSGGFIRNKWIAYERRASACDRWIGF